MSVYCSATTEVEIDGETYPLTCTQREGHPEDHSARVWWANTDLPAGVQLPGSETDR